MKKIILPSCFKWIVFIGIILMLAACAGTKPYVIELMPSPEVYDDGVFDPFVYTGSVIDLPSDEILYATDRLPADGSDESLFYRNQRSDFMRLGEVWAEGMDPAEAEYLYQNEAAISVINVTEASQAAAGNGHGYFRQSPWASSDILATLAYGLSPPERGLVRGGDSPIWSFPADYIERLRAAIIKADPDLKKAVEKN